LIVSSAELAPTLTVARLVSVFVITEATPGFFLVRLARQRRGCDFYRGRRRGAVRERNDGGGGGLW
jgi:hypothetical protein